MHWGETYVLLQDRQWPRTVLRLVLVVRLLSSAVFHDTNLGSGCFVALPCTLIKRPV